MHEIACPHCHKAFTIDEAGYADIVAQVRTKEFDAQLHERLQPPLATPSGLKGRPADTLTTMTTPWLPPAFAHPFRVEVSPGVHLRPISPADLDIDMPAVMGNQQMLWDKYGDAWGWPPTTMSAEDDRTDLARHADEMVRHESFNYAILPSDENSLFGCIYIDPAEPGAGLSAPAAEVSWWVVAQAPPGLDAVLLEFVPSWLARSWPFVDIRYPFGKLG